MPKKFFISDLHLAEERPQTLELFIDFLEAYPKSGDSVFILGDLFDVWIGDDDDSLLALNIKRAFKEMSFNKINLYIQRGNRDFLLGKKFMQETGAKLLPDPVTINVTGKKTLLMHGDLLCSDDVNYLKARKKLRNPIFQWIALRRSLESRRALAKKYRELSQNAIAEKDPNIMDAKNETILKYLTKFKADQLIHGHTHRPAIHKHTLKNGKIVKRIVLDEWHKNYASIWIDDDENFFQETINLSR